MKKKRNSLLKKSTLIIVVLVISIVVVLETFFYFYTVGSLKNEFRSKGESIASLFALACKKSVGEANCNDISEVLLNLSSQNDIVYSYVYDRDGKVISYQSKIEFDDLIDNRIVDRMKNDEKYFIEGKIWEFYYPISVSGEDFLESFEKTFIGFVRIGISEEYLKSSIFKMLRISLFFTLMALLAGIFTATILVGILINPVVKISNEVSSIGTDLTKRIEKKENNEIGYLSDGINEFLNELSEVVIELKKSAPKLFEQSDNLSSTTEQLLASSQEISSSIQEIANSSQKQMESVMHILEKAKITDNNVFETQQAALKAKEMSQNTLKNSIEGKFESEKAFKSSEDLVNSIDNLSIKIKNLSEELKKIPEIMNTINNISNKTSLLSLNAMIEAARAGEYGRGFSVVAQEITKLANNSKEKAKEIDLIVKGILEKTEMLIEESLKTKDGINSSKGIFFDISGKLKNISEDMENSVLEIENIAQKSEISKNAMSELSTYIEKISKESEQNAAAAQEVSAAVEEETASFNSLSESILTLKNIAEEMKRYVDRFNV
ncbi:MAG: methyl-accepting chemotaxis protein [candidate division WOR-3 bacterium]